MVQAWKPENSLELYGVQRWGSGYFDVDKQGDLLVRPNKDESQSANVKDIVDRLVRKKIGFPVLLRFPQILSHRVDELHESFNDAISRYGYEGKYQAVFPIKVNQRKEVVLELLKAGKKYGYGLEIGTKSELLAALALDPKPSSLLVCNGFKDESFAKLAFDASLVKEKLFVVLDEIGELPVIFEQADSSGHMPLLGIRVKLHMRGAGRWISSGGELAKFGLSGSDVLEIVESLKIKGYLDKLRMLHFHLGSQITNIKRIQDAIREAARLYAELRKMGADIEYVNVGGGLGVDYDGSKSVSDSSMNYTIQEYANNVVYIMNLICEEEDVPPPKLVSESGRAVTAHHSLLVFNVKGKMHADQDPDSVTISEDDPNVLYELRDTYSDLNKKNFVEYYHDALILKEDLVNMFNLSQIDLKQLAKGEVLFKGICQRVSKYAKDTGNRSKEFEDLKRSVAKRYICNFSVFQSLPDYWGVGQLFPVMPIHRLNEPPDEYGTLLDATCDSDGEIDRFIDVRELKDVLELHSLTEEPYYLGIFLLGAY
ncbi:MAG: biosynthetic arginine decarboxylase, partial [Thermoplasmata archaeon]|nr:biosynthetic arginine decarboxylase [Thermoplasmata archaeon]